MRYENYDIHKSVIKQVIVDQLVGDPEGHIQDPPIDEIEIRELLANLPTGEYNGYWAIHTDLMLAEALKPYFDEKSPYYQGKDFVITHEDLIDMLADLATRIRLRMEKIAKRRVEAKIFDNYVTGFRFS